MGLKEKEFTKCKCHYCKEIYFLCEDDYLCPKCNLSGLIFSEIPLYIKGKYRNNYHLGLDLKKLF